MASVVRLDFLGAVGTPEVTRSPYMDPHAAPIGSREEDARSLAVDLAGTPYRPIRPIGRGGMGTVYEVEHLLLRKRLVLKLLHAARRPDLEDRLRFEAQTLAQLSHPNLLSVFDYGRTQSLRPFLVTELLRGQTLKELLGAKQFLPVHEAVRYVVQALRGLAHAHRAGVIHRDIKTDNLFACEDQRGGDATIKVIDFGIAKLSGDAGEAFADVDPLLVPTGEGMMVGTPSYISPEQIFGHAVDQRTDLFAMGMVLYRLVAGRGPFAYGDVLEIVEANARQTAPAPSTFAPQELPLSLDAVVLRSLEKRPADRFQSALEMVEALQPFVTAPCDAHARAAAPTVLLQPCEAPASAAQPPMRASAGRTARGTERMVPGPAMRRAVMPTVPKPEPHTIRESAGGAMIPATPEATASTENLHRYLVLASAIVFAGTLTLVLLKLLGWT